MSSVAQEFISGVFGTIAGLETEITLFLLAIVGHWLIFGKYKVPSAKGAKGGSVVRVGASKDFKAKDPQHNQPSAALRAGAVLARTVQPFLQRADTDEAALSSEIEGKLSKFSGEAALEVLKGLLDGVGKTATTELLATVRAALRERKLNVDAQLGKSLLQGYLNLGLKSEFDVVLAEIEAAGQVTPSVGTLAMRSALGSSDIDVALARLPAIAVSLQQATAGSTPSAMPQIMLKQLVQLASERAKLPALLNKFLECALLTPAVFEVVLSECATKGGDALRTVKAFGEAKNVALTASATCVLVRCATSAEEAALLLSNAAGRKLVTAGLLTAVASAAMKHDNAALARAVLQQIPLCTVSSELAGVLLRLAAEGPLAGRDAEADVMELYEKHLSGLDVLADFRMGRLVTEAAIRRQRTDLLQQIMGASADPQQMALLKSFGADGRVADAEKVFRACPRKTVCHYNALLDASVDCGDAKVMDRLMGEAIKAGVADAITFNVIIKAHLKRGDIRRAREAVEGMRAMQLLPNCVTFNEILDATVKQKPAEIWTVVEEMRSCGVRPNNITCSILLKSIQKNSRVSDLEWTLEVVDSIGEEIDEVLLSSVCEACIRVRSTDLLKRQLEKQRSDKRVRTQGAHAYGSIIRAYGYIGDVKGVWDTWCDMRKQHVLPTSITLGCMVEAIVANGSPEEAYEVITEALADPQTRPLLNAVIFCSVLKGFSQQKNLERVFALCEEMRELKLQFSAVTYNALIDACAKCGEMRRVPDILDEMVAEKIAPNAITYSTVMKGYCQDGQLDRAFELMDEMKTKRLVPDEVTYNTLLDGCARRGLFDRGMEVLEEMQKAGVSPSNFTLSVVVKLASRSHRVREAFKLCEDLSKKYRLRLNTPVYNNLVQVCTAHHDLSGGLEVLKQMLGEGLKPDSRSYSLLLRAFVSAGKVEDAEGLLRAACGIRGAHPKLAEFSAAALQPRGGLPREVAQETLEGIASQCRAEESQLALQLCQDLRKNAPWLRLDGRLSMQLAARVGQAS